MLLRQHGERGRHQRRPQPRPTPHLPSGHRAHREAISPPAPTVAHVRQQRPEEEYRCAHVCAAHHSRYGLSVDGVGGEEERRCGASQAGVGRQGAGEDGEEARSRHVQRHIRHVVGPWLELRHHVVESVREAGGEGGREEHRLWGGGARWNRNITQGVWESEWD